MVVLELFAKMLDLGSVGHSRSNRGVLPGPVQRAADGAGQKSGAVERWRMPLAAPLEAPDHHRARAALADPDGNGEHRRHAAPPRVLPLGERLHRQFLATTDVHDLVVQEPADEPSPARRFETSERSLESRPLSRVRRQNRPVLVELDERAAIGVHREADLFERMVERGLELFRRHRRQPRRQARQQALEPQPIVAGGGSW